MSAGVAETRTKRWSDVISLRLSEDQVLLILTLIIGAVVGLVVVAFILLTENLGSKLYPMGGAAWRRLVMPVVGSLSTGILLARYFPNARGSGIPQTKVALFIRDGYIRLKTVVGKFGLCSVTLASGIALGREGPSVQVGAGIASVLGRRLGLSTASVKALVPVGASAALAAAFNTPIAAVLFSLEEVMGDMHAPVLGSIVLGSATSWIVLHLLLGDEPLFHVPAYQLVHPVEFLFYAALGVVGGLVSVAFVKLLLWQRKHFLRMPKSSVWLQPAAGGLLVGVLGWFFPKVLGVGYTWVGQALNGQMLLSAMALLVLLKVVATATCYASGNAGGIFGPSLFIGAMMGGAVGAAAHLLAPDYTGGVGAYALVGMGAAFAGIVRVPLTSVIMIFEMTRDYSIIVPLMISNLMAYFISSRLQHEAIYEALQHQDGVHLPSGARAREALLMVGNAYQLAPQVLAATETISRAAASVDREAGAWPVVEEQGLRGMVQLEQLEDAIREGRGEEAVAQLVAEPGPVEELTSERFPHVHPDHPLDTAMRRIAESGFNVLPVVSRANVRELKGTISLPQILSAYNVGKTPEHEVPETGTKTSAPMLLGVLAVLAAVAVLGGFISYYYRAERVARAQRYYQAGNEFVAKDRIDEAIEQYRNAVSISHSTPHRLALGLALAKAGQLNDASVYLEEVLRQNPSSGPANLGMAQVEVQQGNIDAAVTHYQRALYGTWPDRPDEHRLEARLEMVGALRKAGRTAQARAELLATAGALSNDAAGQKRVGQTLIEYGLYQNAADLFRAAIEKNGKDLTAYEGLGDAEYAAADFAAARDAYAAALKIDPTDQRAAQRTGILDQVLVIDPSLKRLGARQRFRRSQVILTMELGELAACGAPETDDVRAAKEEVAREKRPASFSDAADANIALAERLWAQRLQACGIAPADDPLAAVLAKLARR
jgi:CIC family chloride channel protein